MDSNTLLATTRAEFLRTFVEAVNASIPLSIEALYKKADQSHSSIEQGWMLTARSVLRVRQEHMVQQMRKEMEHLLNRSFQTTYNNFRPSVAFQSDTLSLVESSVMEDELRINQVTQGFRNEAEEQLRDLNIRIALLFDQDTINERENPFRPYLFSRCIVSSVETLEQSEALHAILVTQLAEGLAPHVADIYNSVNSQLAKHGIAAQLQLKIKKSPTQSSLPAGYLPSDVLADDANDSASAAMSRGRSAAGGGQYEIGGKPYDIDSRVLSSDAPRGRIEQLLDSVRMMAGGIVNSMPGRSHAQFADTLPAAMAASTPMAAGGAHADKPGWLGSGQAIGDVLRKFLSDSGPSWQAKVASHIAEGEGRPADGAPFANSQLRYDGGLNVPSAQRADSALTSSVRNLQSGHTPLTEQMLDQNGEVRNLLLERRSQLNSEAKGVDEQMTIDIVAMLFEFILRDGQVPAEVRAQLGRLQFLVLKMALRDASLLTQKGHPVRLLINRIGSISLGLKQLDPSGTHVTEEIVRIVATLLEDETEDSLMFAKALDELDAFIAQELRARNTDVERTVQAMEQAQNRTLRFAHTAAQTAQALSDLTIDPYLQNFLQNDWARAIEHADRMDAKRARRYRLLVPDLLWSIVPKLNPDDRSQLFALLPIILNTLREGLGLIGWDSARQQELLNWLVDAHTNALRAPPGAPPSPPLPVIHEHFSKFIDNPEAMPAAGVSSDIPENRQFLDDAIKEMNLEVHWIDRMLEHDQELAADAPGKRGAVAGDQAREEASVLQRLQNGVSLEINLGGKPSQGRLSWVDPNLSSLVLTLDGQSAPSMVSVSMFRRLINHGRVRFLEAEPLFERAVQSLLLSADNMAHAVQ
ncbi:DUF1631 family protein [Undibacterium sp.]|jgi:hypothetical protein|uniref:DUF1631 family protein n=1 Tax=Undibacterium sp. TaxID=1914977 RepID=UPI002BD568E9|nr:DUF1631 family protein [Undibacterium sp.]HTD05736.1 DUF1631 family protein [Undibacterium sp.]